MITLHLTATDDEIVSALRNPELDPVKLLGNGNYAYISAYPAFGEFEIEISTPSEGDATSATYWTLSGLATGDRVEQIFLAYRRYELANEPHRILQLAKFSKGRATLNLTVEPSVAVVTPVPASVQKLIDLEKRLQHATPLNNHGEPQVSIDFDNGVFVLRYDNFSAMKDVDDVVHCGVEINDERYMETSSASMVGRAVVGGLLTGGLGALIGGTTARRDQKEKVKSVRLVLSFADTPSYMMKLDLYSSSRLFGKHTAQTAQDQANAVVSWIERTRAARQTATAPAPAPAPGPGSPTLANQLEQLAALFSQGLLTSDEFQAAKARLLGT